MAEQTCDKQPRDCRETAASLLPPLSPSPPLSLARSPPHVLLPHPSLFQTCCAMHIVSPIRACMQPASSDPFCMHADSASIADAQAERTAAASETAGGGGAASAAASAAAPPAAGAETVEALVAIGVSASRSVATTPFCKTILARSSSSPGVSPAGRTYRTTHRTEPTLDSVLWGVWDKPHVHQDGRHTVRVVQRGQRSPRLPRGGRVVVVDDVPHLRVRAGVRVRVRVRVRVKRQYRASGWG